MDRTLFWDSKAQRSILQGKWKSLITKKTPNAKLQIVDTPNGTCLYNLEEDPGESVNLAASYPEVVERLSRLLKDWQKVN